MLPKGLKKAKARALSSREEFTSFGKGGNQTDGGFQTGDDHD